MRRINSVLFQLPNGGQNKGHNFGLNGRIFLTFFYHRCNDVLAQGRWRRATASFQRVLARPQTNDFVFRTRNCTSVGRTVHVTRVSHRNVRHMRSQKKCSTLLHFIIDNGLVQVPMTMAYTNANHRNGRCRGQSPGQSLTFLTCHMVDRILQSSYITATCQLVVLHLRHGGTKGEHKLQYCL